jgi:hypothetical protein
VSDHPSSKVDMVWSDLPNATSRERDVWDDMDTDPATIPCQDKIPAVRKSFALVDDDDSASIFTMVRRNGASQETTMVVPSFEAGEQVGDGGQSETSAQEGGPLEEEPLDYGPSPLREKNLEKSPQRDDDVYSLSRLSPPQPSLHKV